ncbi:MAG: hypothetical protein HYX97_05105, partial [Chloroflexi bacterium]|nr:hypothetical protein [Chloroflexota bacterium]
MIRTPTMIEAPTVAWFSYRAGENAARPRTRMLAPKTRIRDFTEVYLPIRHKGQTWVYSRAGRIQALLSLHQRSSPTAWEVERLLLGHACRDLCPELLDTLALEAGQHGAATLFLRLDADSPLVEAAQRAGFLCYQRETLLTAHPPKRQTSELGAQYMLRLRREEDPHALFRLYNAAVPASVRMAQGLTLDQWQGAAE